MKQRWIAFYNGLENHGYVETHREGPFPSMVVALTRLEELYGEDWVDENVSHLVCGPEDGSMAWVTDEQGLSIENSPVD